MRRRLRADRLSHLAYGETFPTSAQRRALENHEADLTRTPTYEMLSPGDLIDEGDEFLSTRGWVETTSEAGTEVPPEAEGSYRRIIQEDS